MTDNQKLSTTTGSMCWLDSEVHQAKILYLRLRPGEPYRPYTAFPKLAKPDYEIAKGSKGWATYQFLRKAGWPLEASPQD